MVTISCIIVDDERIAREGIQAYVKEIGFLDLKGVFKNAVEANTFLSGNKVDLMFLDIEMPMISGIDFLKSLSNAPYTIFTTAYSQYALEGYQFDVIDYLVKPISFERFLQAVNKAVRLINKIEVAQETLQASSSSKSFKSTDLFVKADNKLVKVNVDEIIYIEGMQNYVHFYTETEKVTSRMTLKNVMSSLPADQFIQCHKSYIVAKRKIKAIEGNMLLIEKQSIPISRRLKEEIMDELVKNKLG